MSQRVAVLLSEFPQAAELITLQWENSGSGRWKFMMGSNQAPYEFLNLNVLTERYSLRWNK